MELTYVHAVAAFSGSASGTLATVLTGLFTQGRKDRALRRSQAISQRQELYKSFVEEASRTPRGCADQRGLRRFETRQLVRPHRPNANPVER